MWTGRRGADWEKRHSPELSTGKWAAVASAHKASERRVLHILKHVIALQAVEPCGCIGCGHAVVNTYSRAGHCLAI
jgi:hypothetical protein